MEELPGRRNSTRQDDLVRRYCEEAGSLLATVQDYPSAILLKEQLCGRFEKECDSSLVVDAVRQYMENLLKEMWGEVKDGSDSPYDSR